MAARVRNSNNIDFGEMGAAVTISHGRVQKAGNDPVVIPLSSNLVVAQDEELRIPALMMALKYNTGDLTDDHMDALIKAYWQGETFQVDAMTSSTQVVTTSGYSQQTTSAFSFDTPSDT